LKRSFTLITACVLAALALATPAARSLAAPTQLATAAKAEKVELIDLNSASKPTLMKLPAIGDAIADKIIAGRPWKSKYDLVVKKLVTRTAYDKFSKYVVARQPAVN
jgi:DNA uptake protein ComE-like DNA-binding protein